MGGQRFVTLVEVVVFVFVFVLVVVVDVPVGVVVVVVVLVTTVPLLLFDPFFLLTIVVVVTPITAQDVKSVPWVNQPQYQQLAAPAPRPTSEALTPGMEELTSGSAFSKMYSLLLTVFGPSPVLKTMRPS
ncbi:hypothetical protein VU12_08290 [Desulfobulbus sp. US4]|nr:hypothetical protein [Desulfobulbus sp. US4]